VFVIRRSVIHGIAQLSENGELVFVEPEIVMVVAGQRGGHGKAG